jgi:hypothetical protein
MSSVKPTRARNLWRPQLALAGVAVVLPAAAQQAQSKRPRHAD